LTRNFHFISEDEENEKKEGKKGGEQEKGFNAQIVDDLVTNKKTYHEFRRGLEDGPHRWIHRGIGGEMPLPWSTNGLFPPLLLSSLPLFAPPIQPYPSNMFFHIVALISLFHC